MQFSWRDLPQWQIDIIFKYPSIYLEPSPVVMKWFADCPEEKMDHECFCNLRHGFEFDSGWAGLTDEFSSTAVALVSALRSFGLQEDAWIKSCIFKEKFAALVWQGHTNLIEPFRKLFFAYIRSIETESRSICERSGAQGELRQFGGWCVTLSDAEYRKELRRRDGGKKK